MSSQPKAMPPAARARRIFVDGPRGVRVPFREITPHPTRDRFGRAEENETTRNAYQSGDLDVAIFTVTESISLHQGELPGGDRPRAQVIHDMRHSAVQLQQIEGRSNRDSSGAVIYYTYAEDTVEEAITAPRVHLDEGHLHCEGGADPAQLDRLERLGYELVRWRRRNLYFGGVSAVEVAEDGSLAAAGDPRRGGHGVVVR